MENTSYRQHCLNRSKAQAAIELIEFQLAVAMLTENHQMINELEIANDLARDKAHTIARRFIARLLCGPAFSRERGAITAEVHADLKKLADAGDRGL